MKREPSANIEFGIGARDGLSLRVSVATLVRVVFQHPENGTPMLALERRATLNRTETGDVIKVRSQPFGGAIRVHDLRQLQTLLGDFHFDSERSRAEQDFRLFIRPTDWEKLSRFCIEQFNRADGLAMETSPHRELVEEFLDVLNVQVRGDLFNYRSLRTVLENKPIPGENFYARGYPTARIYRIFEVHIQDAALARALLTNGASCSDAQLQERALQDARDGGNGWANAVLSLPLQEVVAFYTGLLPEARNYPVTFQGFQLDETVAALLNDVTVPKYQAL